MKCNKHRLGWSCLRLLGLLLLVVLINGTTASIRADGTVSLTTLDVAYTQNFDTLANAGTSDVTPLGWDFTESGTNANTTYAAGTGSDTGGNTYSFGASGSTERAFGGLLSGSLVPIVGASFTNDTGSTFNEITIAYTGEQWRLGAADRTDRLDFEYSIDATNLTDGTWQNFDSLDFSTPNTTGPTGAKDGNSALNRMALNATIEGLNIPAGSTFWIRWSDFNPAGSDDGLAVDDFSLTPSVGADVPPTVLSTDPANGASDVDQAANLTISFSEDVTVTGDWFDISCATSGDRAVSDTVVTGGPSSYTINPNTDFALSENCTVIVHAAQIADQDAPVDPMAADYVFSFTVEEPLTFTAIHDIQGNGDASPLDGSVVTIEGIVVGDFQESGELRGYYVQEEDTDVDADPATSEGIFVFSTLTAVSLGDRVQVTGEVDEFQNQTQLSNVGTVTVVNSSNPLPSPAIIVLPLAASSEWERYEGMNATVSSSDGELEVGELFRLGRGGTITLADSRLTQFTHTQDPSVVGYAAHLEDVARRSFHLDDGSTYTQNPDPIRFGRGGSPLSASNTLRSGDTIASVTGVLMYGWGGWSTAPNGYRMHVRQGDTVNFQPANPRPEIPDAVGGTLRVSTFNVLNYFSTIDAGPDICGPSGGMDCRGADSATELTRQQDKIFAALEEIDADIVGLVEIENNASSSLQSFVDGLNARMGAGTYTYIDTGTIGTDAIKVAFIYKPATVTPVGPHAILDTSVDPRFLDSKNRPALAQTFDQLANAERLTVVVNHFKSKGSDCLDVGDPDIGDGQANCNITRTNAAEALVDWLATDPTSSGDSDFLIVGDLNSYAQEDPIDAIREGANDIPGDGDDYQDLIAGFLGTGGYSYLFDGQLGYLDHGLASTTLVSQVAGVTEWHINADEPPVLDYNVEFKSAGQVQSLYSPDEYRSSDHDPLIIGLNLQPLAVTMAGFDATPEGESILVTWQTASESNTRGFNVWRGMSAVEPSEQLNDTIIPSQVPGSSQGASYEWLDDSVDAGVTYYYWIEDVDTNGTATRHGPVSATVAAPTAIILQSLDSGQSGQSWGWTLLVGLLAAGALVVARRRAA